MFFLIRRELPVFRSLLLFHPQKSNIPPVSETERWPTLETLSCSPIKIKINSYKKLVIKFRLEN